MTIRIAGFGAAVAACLLVAPAYADDCAVTSAAVRLVPTKSYRATSTTTRAGQTHTSHIIMVDGKMYIELGGVWKTSQVTPGQLLDAINTGMKTARLNCRKAGSETINGQPTTIYMVHNVNQGLVSDNRLWISAAGLPLKVETNMGAAGGIAVSVYDYTNVTVPPGVK
jgi:hypothetical protein